MSKTTKGTMSNPKRKYYPTTLKPWEEFTRAQEEIFSQVHDLYHPAEEPALRLLHSLIVIESKGEPYLQTKLESEDTLRAYATDALARPVSEIINNVVRMEQAQDRLGLRLGQGLVFANDPNSLSKADDEVHERLSVAPPRTPPPHSSRAANANLGSGQICESTPTRADQYGVYQAVDNNSRRLLFVAEYKPPHKLSAGYGQRGFRPMDVRKEVIERNTIPPPISAHNEPASPTPAARGRAESQRQKQARERKEAEAAKAKDEAIQARLQYTADKLVVAVATQTFHYMIENGLEYSFITTGESFVFLHVREDDPTTLYYHVTVPGDEVHDADFAACASRTAVAQTMSFCLMSFRSTPRSQEWRKEAKHKLQQHPVDTYSTVVHETPKTERLLARQRRLPKPPRYCGSRKGVIKSDYHLRPRDNRRDPSDDETGAVDPVGQASSSAGPSAPAASAAPSGADRQTDEGSLDSISPVNILQRPYCTQKCLLGLKRGLRIDGKCPNAASHPKRKGRHAIDQAEFLHLVQQQLAANLDDDFQPLGLQGARGALFKVRLVSHGYVLVGKGTVWAFVPDMTNERRVYKYLEALQGTAVPVCLGDIPLLEHYCLDLHVMILRLLLMSWGGEDTARRSPTAEEIPDLQAQIRRTVAEVQAAGIDQDDLREPNLLWNEETQRIMLIDFERATKIEGASGIGTIGKADLISQEGSDDGEVPEPEACHERDALPEETQVSAFSGSPAVMMARTSRLISSSL